MAGSCQSGSAGRIRMVRMREQSLDCDRIRIPSATTRMSRYDSTRTLKFGKRLKYLLSRHPRIAVGAFPLHVGSGVPFCRREIPVESRGNLPAFHHIDSHQAGKFARVRRLYLVGICHHSLIFLAERERRRPHAVYLGRHDKTVLKPCDFRCRKNHQPLGARAQLKSLTACG